MNHGYGSVKHPLHELCLRPLRTGRAPFVLESEFIPRQMTGSMVDILRWGQKEQVRTGHFWGFSSRPDARPSNSDGLRLLSSPSFGHCTGDPSLSGPVMR